MLIDDIKIWCFSMKVMVMVMVMAMAKVMGPTARTRVCIPKGETTLVQYNHSIHNPNLGRQC